MRKNYRLGYFCLCVLTLLFQTKLSNSFPKNINFKSSNVIESKDFIEEEQMSANPYSEMFSEREDERRNNNPNLIRKKKSLRSSDLLAKKENTFPTQEKAKFISESIKNDFAKNKFFKEIAENSKIQFDNSNKHPYVRRKRNLENNKDTISKRETDDNTDSESTLDGLENDVSNEEEDTEEKSDEQENLKRFKRECHQNPDMKKYIIKRKADYEESVNDDDSNIEEEEFEEDESESRNENRVKRNEEDSDRDYEKELKSQAELYDEENLAEKEESQKETLQEKRPLESNSKNEKIQRRNLEISEGTREEVDNSEDDQALNSNKKLISIQNLEVNEKLNNPNLISDQNKKLEADNKLDKEDSEINGNIDLEVKEDESEDDYEKRVEDQIQQKIDAIKEEIKREVEEKQKIEEIQENNDKYDELRQEEEDESQNLESNDQIVSKRCLKKEDFGSEKSKRQVAKRRGRSNSGNKKVQVHKSIQKRSAPEYGGDANQDQKEEIITNQKLELDFNPSNDDKGRIKRSNSRALRRVSKRRAKSLFPRRRLVNLRYRPQNIDDDNEDEGSEFEDDGFDDQTSNLNEGRLNFESSPGLNSKLERDADQLNDPRNFLLNNNRNYVTRGKRAKGSRKKRHQRKRRRKKTTSVKNAENRDKRRTGSSEELNPRLALDYKEAFGGQQRDSHQNLARFKRIKRVLRIS